jgi:hypothetical protein
LLIASNEFVGYNGSGLSYNFTQNGGTNSFTGGLYLSYAYNLAGGLLTGGTISEVGGSGLGQTGGTFGPGTLVNTGIFLYSGGVFNGRLVTSGGTFVAGTLTQSGTQAISFYAGQGIENDGILAVPPGTAMGTNGAPIRLTTRRRSTSAAAPSQADRPSAAAARSSTTG